MRRDLTWHSQTTIPLSVSCYESGRAQGCLIWLQSWDQPDNPVFVSHVCEYLAAACLDVIVVRPAYEIWLEAHADVYTYTQELQAYRSLIHACACGHLSATQPASLGLMGIGMGGTMSLLAAWHEPQVQAVVTWGAMPRLDRYDADVIADRHPYKSLTPPRLPMQTGLMLREDITAHGHSTLSVREAIRQLRRPLLLLHGTADTEVPLHEVELLHIFGDPDQTHLRLIPHGDQTWGCTCPFITPPPTQLSLALSFTRDFFEASLM
ncbi:MAG: hypothetical protein SF053_02625 [Bacteroidia bacterium]|nr:hypothetical protein [Bacteroidia bacterium]